MNINIKKDFYIIYIYIYGYKYKDKDFYIIFPEFALGRLLLFCSLLASAATRPCGRRAS